jgi:hypothetical protein
MAEIINDWYKAYPIDIFPDAPKDMDPILKTQVSAMMGRHMSKRLLEALKAMNE